MIEDTTPPPMPAEPELRKSPPERRVYPLVMLISIFVGAAVVFGSIGYFLGYRHFPKSTSVMPVSPIPVATLQPSVSNESRDTELAEYASVDFPECGTTFSIPRQRAVAYQPSWQAPRGVTYPNLLALVNPQLTPESYAQFMALYTEPDAASGQILAAVSVSCANFRMNITLNDEIFNAIVRGVEAYNLSTAERGMGPESFTAKQTPMKKWGRDVLMVTLNNEAYYTFVSDKNFGIYEVHAFGSTQDPQVLAEQQRILDTLRFE